MYQFLTEMCTYVQNGALWDICLMHCGICEMGLLIGIGLQMRVCAPPT